ncbi:hypothetical protein MKP07_02020 [Niabella hibiscisoli]|nr:hypothetical protein [Niabella hibiscisoli]
MLKPISNLDVLPTLAQWTKSKPPANTLDGQSISGFLTTKNYNQSHRPIYYHNTKLEGVKEGDWKLRITQKDSGELRELFNLAWDPSERVNLFEYPKYSKEKEHLLQLFKEFPKGK